MKLLALEKAGDAFVGIVEEGAIYREFWTTKSGVFMGHEYLKERYGDHRRFAAIFGKFDPWPFFASEPPENKDLEHATLESLAATMPTRERRDSSDLLAARPERRGI